PAPLGRLAALPLAKDADPEQLERALGAAFGGRFTARVEGSGEERVLSFSRADGVQGTMATAATALGSSGTGFLVIGPQADEAGLVNSARALARELADPARCAGSEAEPEETLHRLSNAGRRAGLASWDLPAEVSPDIPLYVATAGDLGKASRGLYLVAFAASPAFATRFVAVARHRPLPAPDEPFREELLSQPFRSRAPLVTGDMSIAEAVAAVRLGVSKGVPISDLGSRVIASRHGPGPEDVSFFLKPESGGVLLQASFHRESPEAELLSRLVGAPEDRAAFLGSLVLSGRLGPAVCDPYQGEAHPLLDTAFEWRLPGR
ncbi:MAG: hypothetical protein JNK60_23080, partial [Acidobacteria bacterium]|nr:hypothetical protein [Acidobacteriota bacterium]